MLGEALIDTEGIERVEEGNAPGLGLLPLVTAFARDKTVRPTRARFGALPGAWSALSGVEVAGYEIHHGQTAQHPAMAAKGDVAREVASGLAWSNAAGNVLGLYLHGLFEDAAALRALFGAQAPTLDGVFDGLAACIGAHFAPGTLDGLLQ
jgi:adenosylcobyric acid synthase